MHYCCICLFVFRHLPVYTSTCSPKLGAIRDDVVLNLPNVDSTGNPVVLAISSTYAPQLAQILLGTNQTYGVYQSIHLEDIVYSPSLPQR
jgi:hypothetical protein